MGRDTVLEGGGVGAGKGFSSEPHFLYPTREEYWGTVRSVGWKLVKEEEDGEGGPAYIPGVEQDISEVKIWMILL